MEKKTGLAAMIAGVGVEWILPAFTVSLIFVMLVPLPSVLLDVLLTLSITISMLVLLAALQVLKPVAIFGLSQPDPAADPAPPVAGSGQQPAHSAARERRCIRRRQA